MNKQTGFFLILLVSITTAMFCGGCAVPEDLEDIKIQPGGEHSVDPPPERDTTPDKPSVNDGKVVTSVGKSLPPRMSDAQKQKIINETLMNLMRVIVCGNETVELSDGNERTSTGLEKLTSRLAELGFNVIQNDGKLSFNPSESEQNHFRYENKCNLLFLLKGQARQADKFGNFYSFQCKQKMKVLNLTTHQVIALKTFTSRGKRATSQTDAAESAIEKTTGELANYITDEIIRKWEVASLLRVKLRVTDLDTVAMADDIRVGLQKRVGIYYVSLERWDKSSEIGEYEILCRANVQRFLAAYIDEVCKGHVKVKTLSRNFVTAERSKTNIRLID